MLSRQQVSAFSRTLTCPVTPVSESDRLTDLPDTVLGQDNALTEDSGQRAVLGQSSDREAVRTRQ
ncbi:hypothetical protein CP971_17610 [Streptomyces viridifaciens]|nr:hypothetical protein CP971_17610 [Streptomyces viridifaciens]